MSQYIVSTMTNSVNYCFYGETVPNGVPTAKKKILIHGGAGLPSVRSGFGNMSTTTEGSPMWTADGVVTPVSDSDVAELMTNHVFKKHLESGYVKIIGKDITGNHKAVTKEVSTMEARDSFAQLTPSTFKQKVKVTTQLENNDEFRL